MNTVFKYRQDTDVKHNASSDLVPFSSYNTREPIK